MFVGAEQPTNGKKKKKKLGWGGGRIDEVLWKSKNLTYLPLDFRQVLLTILYKE